MHALFDLFRRVFPDFRAEILDQIAEGDRADAEGVPWHHRGELLGIAPTEREVRIDLIDIVRVEDGRIVEHWNLLDQLGLMRELGAIES